MTTIAIFGCGALGSQIALQIAHLSQPILHLWDDDKVEDVNILTSAFSFHHIGMPKVEALAEIIYRKHYNIIPHTHISTLDVPLSRLPLYCDTQLVIDCFDNTTARKLLFNQGTPTLHVGVSDAGTGSVIWDEEYSLPPDDYARGENPVCTHHLSKSLLHFTSAVASGIIESHLETGEKRSLVVTNRMEVLK